MHFYGIFSFSYFPSTCLSWKVIGDLGFLFDESLETRDTIKEPGRKRGYSGDKIRREEK